MKETSTHFENVINEPEIFDTNKLRSYTFAEIHKHAKDFRKFLTSIQEGKDIRKMGEEKIQEYADLLRVDRVVEIMLTHDPLNIDTIAGIDVRGRQYAKLIKKAYDMVRSKNSLPKTKMIFLNLHVAPRGMSTNIEPSYEENKKFMNKDYGNLLAIDDVMFSGDTQDFFYNFMDKMKTDYHTNVRPVDYIYFLRDRNDSLLFENPSLGGRIHYLEGKDDSEKSRPSLLSKISKIEREKLDSRVRHSTIRSINSKIQKIASMSAEVYANTKNRDKTKV